MYSKELEKARKTRFAPNQIFQNFIQAECPRQTGLPVDMSERSVFFTIKTNSGTRMRFIIKATPLLFTLPPIPFRHPCLGFCFFMAVHDCWHLQNQLYLHPFNRRLKILTKRPILIKLSGNESGGGEAMNLIICTRSPSLSVVVP